MAVRKIVNQRIEELRKSRGLTQPEFAEKLGLEGPKGRSTVNNWEQGLVQVKSDDLIKIAKTFNVSTDYLLGIREDETNDKSAQTAIDYTGLSVDAVKAIREVNFAFGNNELFRDVSNKFFSMFWREFVSDLAELIHEIDYVSFVLETKQDYSIGASVETITNLKRELQIALFTFSERCRYISDHIGGRHTLRLIQGEERFLNSLILEREAADDGQHIEASDN